MRYLLLISTFFLLWLPSHAQCGRLIEYEPTVTVLSGKVSSGKFKHPNGQWVSFTIIKLDKPVSVRSSPKVEMYTGERNIREVQIYSDSNKINRFLKRRHGNTITVVGGVFHEFTAWHIRPLVMRVVHAY